MSNVTLPPLAHLQSPPTNQSVKKINKPLNPSTKSSFTPVKQSQKKAEEEANRRRSSNKKDDITINRFTREVAIPITGLLSSAKALQGNYLLLKEHYGTKPKDVIFDSNNPVERRLISQLYDPAKPLSNALTRLMAPETLQETNKAAEMQQLHRKGATASAVSGAVRTGSKAILMGGNLLALMNPPKENPNTNKVGASNPSTDKENLLALTKTPRKNLNTKIVDPSNSSNDRENTQLQPAIDMASGASDLLDGVMSGVGASFVGKGKETAATRWLEKGQGLNIISSGLLTLSGLRRVAKEVQKAGNGEQPNSSSLGYAVSDTLNGVLGGVYSLETLKKAKEATGAVDKNKILMGIWNMSPTFKRAMQTLGSAGAAITLAINGRDLISAANQRTNDPKLSAVQQKSAVDKRNHQMISAAIGAGGSLAMVAGAAMVSPAVMPVASSLYTAGSAALLAQSFYDLKYRTSSN
jgi:hypothetical protein